MSHTYLFGPVTADYARHYLQPLIDTGECLPFGHAGVGPLSLTGAGGWEELAARFPDGWRPDFLVLNLSYNWLPTWLWQAPLPLVGLADDAQLQWHAFRHLLPFCDLVLADAPSVARLHRLGCTHAREANLFGCAPALLEAPGEESPRDIDVLFVGNMHPAVQRERLPWLGRLAEFKARWNVVIASGVFGEGYAALLRRSRVVFNRSVRGECNKRVFEAPARGALLFQERGNAEVPRYFRDGLECVYYGDEDLEELLEQYLGDEVRRRALAGAARARVRHYTFDSLWRQALALIDREWPALQERAARRASQGDAPSLPARAWQALSAAADPSLAGDLAAALAERPQDASLHNALGLVRTLQGRGGGPVTSGLAARAAQHFRLALAADPRNVMASLNLVEALVGIGQEGLAAEGARRTLDMLARQAGVSPESLDCGHFPPAFDLFRVEWERAGWDHAGDPPGEAGAKGALLRWRLHSVLADLTGDLAHYYEAALARPDLPVSRAALGCALGRAGHPAEAIPHLLFAVASNPFDREAARALYQALNDAGHADEAHRFTRHRRLLHEAAPGLVPAEGWFLETLPRGTAVPPVRGAALTTARRPRVSLCMIVKDEEHNLPDCLTSVADLVDELVVVDTGSKDNTREVAARHGAKVIDFPWPDSFAVARNQTLGHATGDWVFWMDADDRLDEVNRGKLKRLFAGLGRGGGVVAYSMKCLCLPDPASGACTVVDHVRLFPRHPQVRWEYRVHEQVLPSIRRLGGEVRWADVVIHHTGYQDPALRGGKLRRDLRLLRLDRAEHPDEPFILFNLGSIYQEQGRHAEAIPLLRRSLERSHPSDSIVRKLHALIAGCHRTLGQRDHALAACREGRAHYPEDAELLYLEGVLAAELGNYPAAEACLLQLLATPPGNHFASVDAGLTGYKGRHQLAVVLLKQRRYEEAEAQWRLATAERPDWLPGWLGLAEAALAQGKWELLEEAARAAEPLPHGGLEAAILRGRGLLARQEFDAARALADRLIAGHPGEGGPRVLLSHVLLQEGRDPEAAEKALRDILLLDPAHQEAMNNLSVVLRQRLRTEDQVFEARGELTGWVLAARYQQACATPSDINVYLPTLYELARECKHVTEFGTRTGVSTLAFLRAQPDRLVCYDLVRLPQGDPLAALAGRTEFVFRQEDVLEAELEETDLLFIDTWHVEQQLAAELRLHAGKVRKYVVLHDTSTYGEVGETEGHRGLWPAVEAFLAQGTFRLRVRYENNNGLTVLERA